MSQRPFPQRQLQVGLVNAVLFGYFWPFLCNNVRQDVGTQSLETVKVRLFLFFSRGDFLEINVFSSVFEHICKNLLFSFLHSNRLFPYNIFPLSF